MERLKKGLLLFICFGCLLDCFKPKVIKGTVKDNKSHPIPGASITHQGYLMMALPAIRPAILVFQPRKKGTRSLTYRRVSYKPFEQPVSTFR